MNTKQKVVTMDRYLYRKLQIKLCRPVTEIGVKSPAEIIDTTLRIIHIIYSLVKNSIAYFYSQYDFEIPESIMPESSIYFRG